MIIPNIYLYICEKNKCSKPAKPPTSIYNGYTSPARPEGKALEI